MTQESSGILFFFTSVETNSKTLDTLKKPVQM